MAGFIIPLTKWSVLNKEIKDLKEKYFKNEYMNLKDIRRNKYDENQYWNSLTSEQKEEFNKEFYEIISRKDYTILAGIINKEGMEDKSKELQFYLSYSFILQRFEYFLDENDSQGIIIMDSAEASKEINELYDKHKRFLREGVPTKRKDLTLKVGGNEFSFKDYERRKITRVCENLLFLNDDDTNMLQIVDMISSAMFAKFNRKIDVWFNKIKSNIRARKSDGLMLGYGLKFFPELPKDISI